MDYPVIRAARGSLNLAVEGIHALLRLLVAKWAEGEPDQVAGIPFGVNGSDILLELNVDQGQPAYSELCQRIAEEWIRQTKGRRLVPERDLIFSRMVRRMLPPDVPDADVKYYFMRSIRRRYGLYPSAEAARAMHLLTGAVESQVLRRHGPVIPYRILLDILALTAAPVDSAESEPESDTGAASYTESAVYGQAFVEECWVLGLIKPAPDRCVRIDSRSAESEYMLSNLFAVPTGIPGFDELFGGGGLIMADSVELLRSLQKGEPGAIEASPTLTTLKGFGGRVVLTIGPFGSGKSLLSLQMAVEVARKGGIAWVMALEQTDEECLYALEAIGVSTKHPRMRVVMGLSDSVLAFAVPDPAQGARVFLRPESAGETGLEEFLKEAQEKLTYMSRYPLRLLVVDPVNAFDQRKSETAEPVRFRTREMFEAAKRANVNVWFTSEQMPHDPQDRIEENIADTVIHLGVEVNAYGQQRRYIEVTKSRFQKEYAGRHALVIEREAGIHVYPSASTLTDSLRGQCPPARGERTTSGVEGMDPLFGPEGLHAGDLIVLAGPGKAKALIGMQFLEGSAPGRAVLFSDYTRERIEHNVHSAAEIGGSGGRLREHNAHRCPLNLTLADPGRILHEIRQVLERENPPDAAHQLPPLRVLIANLARWEKGMPSIADDPSFGIALANLLRGYGVIGMIVSGDDLEPASMLRDTLASHADFVLHFNSREFKGRVTTLVNTVKSPMMRHPREFFELRVEQDAVRIGPAPLFRTNAAGDSIAVPVRLYLHAETPNHKRYNQRIVSALCATLSPNTEMARQSQRYDPQFLAMSRHSAVDELQIFQVDEYQLPNAMRNPELLHRFDAAASERILKDRLPELVSRVRSENGDTYAVPFYQNLSFIAYHKPRFEAAFPGRPLPQSWEDLAGYCQEWERQNPLTDEQLRRAASQPPREGDGNCREVPPEDRPPVFFSCPVYEESVETYNCMFMELLYTVAPPEETQTCDLSEWLKRDEAKSSAILFRKLCRRSHLLSYRSGWPPNSIYWRHWYNTLNQELSEMPAEERSAISVLPLYGGVTTAGEWYLTIPAHSASPDVGLTLIENLTTPEREMQRLQIGVGLPTRESYYLSNGGEEGPQVSPYFHFSRAGLRQILNSAIRRSRFPCYERFSGAISAHLLWILEIPENDNVEAEIGHTMDSLVSNLQFLRQGMACRGCGSAEGGCAS